MASLAVSTPIERTKVMVVDDDYDIRELLVELLEDEGYEAHWARDGRDCLAELKTLRGVRIILLDLAMPGVDGKAFRDLQRSDPELADIPIIVLSGARNCVSVARELGAAAAFPKPFAPDDLLEAMQKLR